MFMIYFRNRIYEPYLNGLLVVTFRPEPKVFEPLTVLHSTECSAGWQQAAGRLCVLLKLILYTQFLAVNLLQ